MQRVNLFSDTQTRPTEGMRRAIAEAEVGDEQRFADPTTIRLQERVAELLGHEAALFLPSGTMCNQIAIRLHTRPGGDELIAAANSHPVNYEAGGPASSAAPWCARSTRPPASSSPTSSRPRSDPRATAMRRDRESSRSSRRRTWAAGACGRSRPSGLSWMSRAPMTCARTWMARG